jgi:hypothetical protein
MRVFVLTVVCFIKAIHKATDNIHSLKYMEWKEVMRTLDYGASDNHVAIAFKVAGRSGCQLKTT